MTIVEKLQEYMSAHKLKLTDIADHTGIPYSRMHKWISGANQPKADDTKILENYMNGETSNVMQDGQVRYSAFSSKDGCMEALNKAMEVILSQQKTIENLLSGREGGIRANAVSG